ncbi:hypothetical protein BJV74DRAFT_137413 [Russula compacta]|nr:hypothetical protein BJV74DRAFT_137413 [Russula compacta]
MFLPSFPFYESHDTDTTNDPGRKQFIDRASSHLGLVGDMCDTLDRPGRTSVGAKNAKRECASVRLYVIWRYEHRRKRLEDGLLYDPAKYDVITSDMQGRTATASACCRRRQSKMPFPVKTLFRLHFNYAKDRGGGGRGARCLSTPTRDKSGLVGGGRKKKKRYSMAWLMA